jgi:hypothetical protein
MEIDDVGYLSLVSTNTSLNIQKSLKHEKGEKKADKHGFIQISLCHADTSCSQDIRTSISYSGLTSPGAASLSQESVAVFLL